MPVPATVDRAGLARSGAFRSGWPIFIGVVLPTYALCGIARSGATRSNYHSSKVCVSVDGVQRAYGRTDDTWKVRNLTLDDVINETPTTALFEAQGFTVTEGQDVIITLGSINNLVREFSGQILALDKTIEGNTAYAANVIYGVHATDRTWGLNKRKVTARYTATTVGAVAASLVGSSVTPGYTLAVSADITSEAIDEITFTNQDRTACLSQLVKRVGGYWYCDHHSVVRLFFEDTSSTAPTALTTVHPTLTEFSSSRDLSQIVTRVYVEGGGVNALAAVAVGETIIPVDDTAWYADAGGVVVCGPQRLTYTGKYAGGGGGLVGTGAAPSGAPALALASGNAGVEDGAHNYAVTFGTAAGESIAGPLVSITTGKEAAPATAPTAGTPTIGTGPNPGSHDYAVTFVTSSGETTAGPSVTRATTLTPDPTTAPTPGTPTVGTGVDDGNHEYEVSFVTSIGETIPGPVSAQAVTGPIAAPASGPSFTRGTIGTGPETGTHVYALTFVNAAGETTPGPSVAFSTDVTTPPASAPVSAATPTIGSGPNTGSHDYAVTFVSSTGETTPGPRLTKATDVTTAPSTGPTAGTGTDGTGPEQGSHDYAVTFVTSAGETTAGPSTTKVTDVVTPPANAPSPSDGPGGGSAPIGVDLAYTFTYATAAGETPPSPESITVQSTGGAVTVTGDASADSAVVNIKLYRSVSGSNFVHIATFANSAHPTWGYFDSIAAGSGFAPSVNTAALNVNHLTAIPLGDANCTSRKIYRTTAGGAQLKLLATIADNTTTTYADGTVDASLGANVPVTNTATLNRIALTAIPIGTSEVTSRKIYRTVAGGSSLLLLATIANNSTTSYNDTTVDGSLGAAAPGSNTAVLNVNHLTAIPTGPATTTARKLYRTAVGSGTLKLLDTIANNSATTYADTTVDADLGASAPGSNTAAVNVVPLSAIPTGDANVTSRKVYRRVAGTSNFRLLTTIANNTTTTYVDSASDASISGAATPLSVSTAYLQRIALSAIPKGGPLVTSRNIYRTAAGGTQLKLLATLADNTTTTFADTVTDASLGTNVPASNTATENHVALSGIPIGAAAVTSRKIYRTVAAGSQLKLLATIADNSTTTYSDTTADASLGANVPTSDTSGLAQPQGNVLAGSTSLVVASIGSFPSSGWAVIGNGQQVIRYTGVSGNVLTGIPASGAGAIAATIAFNSTVTAAPQLTGVPASGDGSILWPILKGDPVNVLVQVDDTARQTALAALISGDGVQDDYIQDRRLSITEAIARGTAQLDLKGDVLVTIKYKVRDINTRSGRTVPVNLGAPTSVTADFVIQSARVSAFWPSINPTYDVQASSIRFSFEDLLRLIRASVEGS